MRTRRSDVFSISGVRIAWRRTIAQWRDDWLESYPAEIVFVGNCAKSRLNEIAIGIPGSFTKTPTCAQHRMVIYELSAQRAYQETEQFLIEPFLLLSPFSSPVADPPGSSFFTTTFSRYRRTLYWGGISDAIEHEILQTADNSKKTELIGRESDVVLGDFWPTAAGDARPVFARRRQRDTETARCSVPAWLGIE